MEFHYEFTGPAGEELAGLFDALYAGMLLVFLLIGLALMNYKKVLEKPKRKANSRSWVLDF